MNLFPANAALAMKIKALTLIFVFATSGSAMAEVCDKARPGWEPGTSIGQLGELIYFVTNPYVAVYALVLLVISTVLKARYIYLPLALPPLFLVWALLSDWWWPGSVTQFAISEGCIGPPYLTMIFLFGLSFIATRRIWQRAT